MPPPRSSHPPDKSKTVIPIRVSSRRRSTQSSDSPTKHSSSQTSPDKRFRTFDANSVDSSYSQGASTSSSLTDRHLIEKILDKKTYNGKDYYKLKLVNSEEPIWDLGNKIDDFLIEQFENTCATVGKVVEEDEWEVEQIIDKRTVKGEVQYLVKWKGWPGGPTWESADKCDCVNLIAIYENPRFKRLWNFQGSNQNLWLSRRRMLNYMQDYIDTHELQVNLLRFTPDFPENEEPLDLEEGLNIGPLRYEKHWYLVIILINHISVTKRILIGDSLNTLIGSQTKTHPVYKRLTRLYKGYPIKIIRLTPMDRSDVCAFYTLASFERALFLLHPKAQFIVESIYCDATKAEMIRTCLKPDTDGEISVALPIPEEYNQGPTCEFCEITFDTRKFLDLHIAKNHIRNDKLPKCLPRTHSTDR